MWLSSVWLVIVLRFSSLFFELLVLLSAVANVVVGVALAVAVAMAVDQSLVALRVWMH